MRLTKNFILEEFEWSETASRFDWDNKVPAEHLENIQAVAEWLQDLRDRLSESYEKDMPITITSGYRSPKLNSKINGSKNSAHKRAAAADFRCPNIPNQALFWFIKDEMHQSSYDQCILEFNSWIHIGVEHRTAINRSQLLIAAHEYDWLGRRSTVYRKV